MCVCVYEYKYSMQHPLVYNVLFVHGGAHVHACVCMCDLRYIVMTLRTMHAIITNSRVQMFSRDYCSWPRSHIDGVTVKRCV